MNHVDEDTACVQARAAMREVHEILKPLADKLLQARTMTKDERQDIGRKINSARSKITTAELWLGAHE
jgi:hypothetical protein